MIALFIGAINISLGLYIYFLLDGDPRMDWDIHLAMAIAVGCFGFVVLRQWRLNRRDEKTKSKRAQHRKKNKPA